MSNRAAQIADLAGTAHPAAGGGPTAQPCRAASHPAEKIINRPDGPEIGPAAAAASPPVPTTLTAADLAVLFDVDTRTIHALRQKGVLTSINPRGTATFDTRTAIAAYLRFSRRANTSDLESEKLRLASAQAEKIELQNAAARGELIPAAEVRAAWLSLATDLRAGILAAPSRIASRLGLDRTMQAAIDSELREALETLDAKEHTQ